MSIYLSVGNQLLSPDEIVEKSITGEIDRIRNEAKEIRLLGFPEGKKAKFTPIGLGRPLSIEIREIYTGEFPQATWHGFNDTQDLIVTTAHKPITQQAVASRAINLVREEVARKSYINNVAATEAGTPIIYYSPALVDSSISVTVEFGFENFPKQVLKKISAALQTAATIPVFATKSMFLLAGGMVTKLMADLGKAIFEKGPEFIGTDSINFNRAGMKDTTSGYGVLFGNNVPRTVIEGYYVNQDGALVQKQTDGPYNKEYPYAVVSLDGAKNTSYENFQQSAASAELLARFYNLGENRTQPIDELLKGLRYYNDMKFRQEATKLEEEINECSNAVERKKLEEKRKALIANILTDELKL